MNRSKAIPRRTPSQIDRVDPHYAYLQRVFDEANSGQGGLLTRQSRSASAWKNCFKLVEPFILGRKLAPRHACPQAPAGFSLIELLVVIAIILVAMAIAGTVISPSGGRPAKAMELVAAMAAVAREDAIATATPTRVAICVDAAAGAKYLRFVTALVDADDNAATTGWKFSVRGQMLPQGTIFWPEYSTAAVAENTMKLDLANPGADHDGSSGSTFVFIEFDASGYPTTNGTQWVFTKAVMDEAGGAPVVPKPMDRDGFILRQTGRLAYFRSPEDISKP